MRIFVSQEDRKAYFYLLEQVFDSGFLSEGEMLRNFEAEFSEFSGLKSLAVSNGGAALQALFEYAKVSGHDVIVPANTFYATALAAKKAGARVIYADCNRDDLCLSVQDLEKRWTPETRAVCVTHIGGHIAFQIEEIAVFCREKKIALIEDCAHAHGASFHGKSAGSWGLGGAYSFYSTKTMPLGEGGMVVSQDQDFLEWLTLYRNYGKQVSGGKVSYVLKDGFNIRMNEVTAAFGRVQLKRLQDILSWKRNLAKKYDQFFLNRVKFPDGMISGYYKYIVFDYDLKEETGKVFARTDFGPEIEGASYDLPNSSWVAEHHHCVPIWYGWPQAELSVPEIKTLLLKETARAFA